MHMHCDKQYVIYIAQNLIFHKKTKHIEVGCHFVRDTWTKKLVTFQSILSSKQLANILIKVASPQVFSNLCNKLGILDIYDPP